MKQKAYTTRALQRRHRDVYQDFFTKNSFVCSVPHILSWGYTASRRVTHHINMKQKLPTRMYVGVQFTELPGHSWDERIMYDSLHDEFDTKTIDQIYSAATVQRLNHQLALRYAEKKYTQGICISILAEQQRGGGFGFSGSLCVALGALLAWLDAPRNTTTVFSYEQQESLFQEALALDISIFHSHDPHGISGLLPKTSLSPGCFPLIQLGSNNYTYHDGAVTTNSDAVVIDSLSLSSTSEIEMLEFDYGIISANMQQYATETRKIYRNNSNDSAREFLNQLILSHGGDVQLPQLPGEENLSQATYEKVVQAYCKVVEGKEKHSVETLIDAVYDAGWVSSLIEKERDYLVHFYSVFNQQKQEASEHLGMMPISRVSAQGSCFFIARKGKSRETVKKCLAVLREQGYGDIHLRYASWRDGWSTTGLEIHQSIADGIFSPYVPIGSLKLLYSDDRILVNDYASLLDAPYKGFLLDTVGKKIYFEGQKLTSRELKSQTMTVEVLLVLLDRLGDDVHNADMPLSSYSKSKNEMVGKIIVPFKKLVMEKCGIDVDIACHGGLYDFYVRLNPRDAYLFHRIIQMGTIQSSYGFLRKESLVMESSGR